MYNSCNSVNWEREQTDHLQVIDLIVMQLMRVKCLATKKNKITDK